MWLFWPLRLCNCAQEEVKSASVTSFRLTYTVYEVSLNVFGKDFPNENQQKMQGKEKISVIWVILNEVKTGDPSACGDVYWPKFTSLTPFFSLKCELKIKA